MKPAMRYPIHPPRWIPKTLKMALATAAPTMPSTVDRGGIPYLR
jgi:hypothetical protein